MSKSKKLPTVSLRRGVGSSMMDRLLFLTIFVNGEDVCFPFFEVTEDKVALRFQRKKDDRVLWRRIK